MPGYWNRPDATAETVTPDGWLRTGDIGYVDEDGFLYITDRAKDMIIRGGENVYPREIEEFLYTHPDISDVQVIGVPSERYGEEVMAWVRLREGASASSEELVAYCRGKIATYKIPRYWKFVDGFPMTVTGKIQKFKMRETAIDELGLHAAASVVTA
jgi:fatty-acyl-CoA synthase